MPKTLLAVDDSVTMRKVVEMTFAGEDLKVRTVATAQEALAACRKDLPDLVFADVSLEGQTGYDLCRAMKDEFRGVPVVVVSSKQNPWDPARGQACGADDHVDKPWDTAKVIELVKRVLSQGKSMAPAPIAAVTPATAASGPRAPMFAAPPAATPSPPIAAPPAVVQPTPRPTPAVQHPTMQGIAQKAKAEPTPMMPKAEPRAAAAPLQAKPAAPAAPVAKTPEPPPAAAPSGNGGAALPAELSSKLRDLGLTSAQVDAVLALSREVVERVVWEVVPVLAETMVKEEIARLTRE